MRQNLKRISGVGILSEKLLTTQIQVKSRPTKFSKFSRSWSNLLVLIIFIKKCVILCSDAFEITLFTSVMKKGKAFRFTPAVVILVA